MGSDLARPLLRIRDVARLLAVSEATIIRWADAGLLPRIKIGNSTRFDPGAVEALIERHLETRDPACRPGAQGVAGASGRAGL